MSILYADGGVIQKNPSEIGGTWAYIIVDDDDETILYRDSGVVTRAEVGVPVTNNQMEFLALVRGLLGHTSLSAHLTEVRSDSNISLGRLFKGWSITNIPQWMIDEWKTALKHYDTKVWTNCLMMKHTLLDGHPTKSQLANGFGKRGHPVSKFNVLCDRMCNEEAQEYKEQTTLHELGYD